MNLDIRENVINKIKKDNAESIIKTLDESINTNDELVLPGLGVILELFWDSLSDNEKQNIAKIITSKLETK